MKTKEEIEFYKQSQIGRLMEDLKETYYSGIPIAYVVTLDHELINEIKKRSCSFFNVNWDIPPVSGHYDDVKTFKDFSKAGLFLFHERIDESTKKDSNAVHFINFVRRRSINQNERCLKSFIIEFCPVVPDVPIELRGYSRVIKVKPKTDREIESIIREGVTHLGVSFNEDVTKDFNYRSFISKFRGMSSERINSVLRSLMAKFGKCYIIKDIDGEESYRSFVKCLDVARRELVMSSSILEFYEADDSPLQGMDNFVEYINNTKAFLDKEKQSQNEYDIIHLLGNVQQKPSGVLISGIPGSGKSQMAKLLSHEFEIPLVRLDMGRLQSKYVGESQKNLMAALDLADAMQPVILWIDEIDKALSGQNSEDGVMRQLVGILLNWMQEKTNSNSNVFLYCTANDISKLPPELFRSGRFDEKFYTFLPSSEECCAIFKSRMKYLNAKYKSNDPSGKELFEKDVYELFDELINTDLFCPNGVPSNCKFMIGSDIASIVNSTMSRLYTDAPLTIGNDEYLFSNDEVRKVLMETIQQTHTYWQTNMKDVAICFYNIAINRFKSVSKNIIVSLESLDITKSNARIIDRMTDGTQYLKLCENDKIFRYNKRRDWQNYDRALYDAIEYAVNNFVHVRN